MVKLHSFDTKVKFGLTIFCYLYDWHAFVNFGYH
jgi:hypothetical protein